MAALGKRSELTEEQLAHKIICGQCALVFETDEEYVDHICEITGFSPSDLRHQMKLEGEEPVRARVIAALKRGEESKKNPPTKEEKTEAKNDVPTLG